MRTFYLFLLFKKGSDGPSFCLKQLVSSSDKPYIIDDFNFLRVF